MRAIISAIMSVFKGAFGFAMAMLAAPLRLFGGGSSSRGAEPLPEVAPPLEIPPEPASDHTEMYARTAVAVQTWAAQSLLADELQPVPVAWPRSIKEWAQGLDRNESFAIIDAPEHTLIGHLSGNFPMPRVRIVQPLLAARWESQEPMTITDPRVPDPSSVSAATVEHS